MYYAVNVADMTQDIIIANFMISAVTPNKIIIDAEPDRLDGSAVLFECESERVEAILYFIREKYHKNVFRVYKSNQVDNKMWERV